MFRVAAAAAGAGAVRIVNTSNTTLSSSIFTSLTHFNSSSVFASSSQHQCRGFSKHAIPIGPRDPDNLYRRPETPIPTSPLSEDDELIWDDAQAPEPALDAHEDIDENQALKQLVMMITGVLGVGVTLFYFIDPKSRKPTVNQTFPFDGLKKELGGPNADK